MLQVARLASKPLGDAADSVVTFLRNQQSADGGFKDRRLLRVRSGQLILDADISNR